MNLRIYLLLLAALLAPPALTQETAPPLAAPPTTPHFDLRSDAIRKIIRDTASTQYANVQESRPAVAKSEPAEFQYVPPEPRAPAPESKITLPEPAPRSDGFLSQVVSIVLEETLGIEDDDGITASNDMLRCRVQKETKTGPAPGVDNCPTAD